MRARRAEEHQRFEHLRTIPILSRCSDEELRRIDALGTDIRIGSGHRLMREAATGFEAVIIMEGTVDVTRDGETIARLGPGNIVGEGALLDGGRRSATVTTSSTVRALVLNSAEFEALGRELPGVRNVVVEIAHRRSPAAVANAS